MNESNEKQPDIQTAIQVWESKPVEIQKFELQQRAARLFAASGLFSDIKGQSPEQSIAQAFVKICLGESMGFNPAEAMTGIDLIQGRVAISANMRAARMQRAGYDWDILQLDNKGCRLQLKCKGQPLMCEEVDAGTGKVSRVPVIVSFTADDAATAGLLSKDNYKKNPRNMFFARAITNAQRWYAPGVLSINILTVEEAESLLPSPSSDVPENSAQSSEDLADLKRIDELYAELGTDEPTKTKQRAKYLTNNKGLIEWLQGQVAKKHNDGGTRRTRKAGENQSPVIESTKEADTKPSADGAAKVIEASPSANTSTTGHEGPRTEPTISAPAGDLFGQSQGPATSHNAPPPIDETGW